jgi:hypothetical protein
MLKKISLLWLLDKGAVIFIFLCVFAFDFAFLGVRLRYLVMMGLIALTPVVCKKELRNKKIVEFYAFVIISYTVLVGYATIRGNDIDNIIFYLKPFLIFMIIPAFAYLFKKNGAERYMKVFTWSVFLLVGLFAYIVIKTINEPGDGLKLNDQQGLILVAVYDFLPRVVIKTFVFLVPATAYLVFKYNGIKLQLCFLLMVVIALLSMTLGIVVAVICVYLIILLLQKRRKDLIPLIVIGSLGYVVYFGLYKDTVMDTKENSADYKTEQMNNFTKDMGPVDLLLGRGIGCKFNDFDSRHIKEDIIEVAAVVLFQSGGLFFSLLFLYAYLGPAIIALLYNKDDFLQMLAVSQIGLFISSLSNPYIWGGSVGLLFMVFIVAYQGAMSYK